MREPGWVLILVLFSVWFVFLLIEGLRHFLAVL